MVAKTLRMKNGSSVRKMARNTLSIEVRPAILRLDKTSEAPSVQNRSLGVGKVAGDVKLNADGKADKIEGEVWNAVSCLKDTLKGN